MPDCIGWLEASESDYGEYYDNRLRCYVAADPDASGRVGVGRMAGVLGGVMIAWFWCALALAGAPAGHSLHVATATRRVDPVYPADARASATEDVLCHVRVSIDEVGRTTDVAFVDCPDGLHESARAALMQWEWKPAVEDGEPTASVLAMSLPYSKGDQPDAARVYDFPYEEMSLRRRVNPEFPDAAKASYAGPVQCRVRVTLDTHGSPTAIEFPACPDAYQGATRDALLQWRWYAPLVGKARCSARFELVVKYVLA